MLRAIAAAKKKSPKMNLNPGSISVAVDCLYNKGLVSRVEDTHDRRVRTVALTPNGRKLISRAFRAHAVAMKRVFSELTVQELEALETALKKAGRKAEGLSNGEKQK